MRSDSVVGARGQRVANHDELFLQQREKAHGERKHEGHLVTEAAEVHSHAPVEWIGGHRKHDESNAHRREAKRDEQTRFQPHTR